MADHVVTADQIGAHHKLLVADEVETVTFEDDVDRIEVVSDGAAPLAFRLDGEAPEAIDDPAAIYMPAAAGVRTLATDGRAPVVVKLISSGTPRISVAEAID